MMNLGLPSGLPIRLLCIGAHSDDIEIGCGGTIRTLLQSRADVSICWFVASGSSNRQEEARIAAERFTDGAQSVELKFASFTDGHFPFESQHIKRLFSEDLRSFQPNLVLTHYRDDRHQDHRTLSDLTWQTFRDHLVLEYEIPKYDGDLGQPNMYVSLSEEVAQFKVATILNCFGSQKSKHWFEEDTFRAIMRLRGMECGSDGRWAEAFYARKIRVL